jgi:hypothetical protein
MNLVHNYAQEPVFPFENDDVIMDLIRPWRLPEPEA